MRRTALTVLCTSLLLTTSAFASGFGLREVSASAFGNAYAGGAAPGGEASTMFFNPALVADVETLDISSSAQGLLPDASGDFTAINSGTMSSQTGPSHIENIVNTALIPSLAVRARLTDQLTVGLQVTVPWGMVTDYGPDWVGRYYATQSDVKTANVTAMVGFQPTPELAIGAGIQVQYIKGRLGKALDFGWMGAYYGAPLSYVAVPGSPVQDGSVLLKAQNWGIGYVLGVSWKPSDKLSLGLAYRSQIDNTLKGKAEFTYGTQLVTLGPYTNTVGGFIAGETGWFQNGGAEADFATPASITFGLRYKITDQLTALVGIDWTGWSSFKELRIVANPNPYSQPDDVTTMNWEDSWFGSLGLQYECHDWVFRIGTAYDGTPTVNDYRTPGIPDGSRYWITIGAGYRLTDHIDLDVSYGHLFFQKGKINLSGTLPENYFRGSLTGTVDMGVNIVGVEASYHL